MWHPQCENPTEVPVQDQDIPLPVQLLANASEEAADGPKCLALGSHKGEPEALGFWLQPALVPAIAATRGSKLAHKSLLPVCNSNFQIK